MTHSDKNSPLSERTTQAIENNIHEAGQYDPVSQADVEGELPTRIQPKGDQHVVKEETRAGRVGVGSVLKDRFIIDKLIGRGGMGVVYRARDNLKEQFHDRDPYLAIKVLSDECKAHPDFLIALQREAGKSQKLAHPNIVTVYDFDTDGNNVFMTMEYLEGESLRCYMSRHGVVNLPSTKIALQFIEKMGQGLAFAHKKGIVHCDFKPGNVFLTNDDNVKILDFGIARVEKRSEQLQQDVTRFDASKLGALTPTYASCELIENVSPDQRDDIYGLACVSYELLTGHHPFNRLPADVARDSHLKPTPVKGLNKNQWKALLRGLAFDRASRPASVTEFLAELTGDQNISGSSLSRMSIVGLSTVVLLTAVVSYAIPRFLNQTELEENLLNALPSGALQPSAELSLEQQKIVTRLLEAAEIHFMVQRITEPVGSNAYEAYKHALEIDPENKEAKAGLNQIADYYESLARKSLPDGDAETTLLIISTGLNVMPQHSGLKKLREEVENKSNRVSSWLEKLW